MRPSALQGRGRVPGRDYFPARPAAELLVLRGPLFRVPLGGSPGPPFASPSVDGLFSLRSQLNASKAAFSRSKDARLPSPSQRRAIYFFHAPNHSGSVLIGYNVSPGRQRALGGQGPGSWAGTGCFTLDVWDEWMSRGGELPTPAPVAWALHLPQRRTVLTTRSPGHLGESLRVGAYDSPTTSTALAPPHFPFFGGRGS